MTADAMKYYCDDHIMSGSQHFTEVFLSFKVFFFLSFLIPFLSYFLSCGESSGGEERVNIDVL